MLTLCVVYCTRPTWQTHTCVFFLRRSLTSEDAPFVKVQRKACVFYIQGGDENAPVGPLIDYFHEVEDKDEGKGKGGNGF